MKLDSNTYNRNPYRNLSRRILWEGVWYANVLLLDVDLAILHSLDHLFELPAPAALQRGNNAKAHGSKIDGRRFFGGEDIETEGGTVVNWCQTAGINAGVMLLEPNVTMHQRALSEVSSPLHPEHVPGSGPEQDYLSRFYAPWWTHIGVAYNFQLHQVGARETRTCCFIPVRIHLRSGQLGIAAGPPVAQGLFTAL